MESILDWNTREGRIFRGGSGSGINLSKIRGSMEPLAKGGTASGPVSFMRGADSWAGTIKSGGKTRRAAKMVVLDIDHPDIRDFIWCKAKEEDKAAALRDAGFDMSIDGDGFQSIQYQNANNSVRVTDEFMHAVENDEDWHLISRVTTGEPVGEPVPARELMREISEAAWRCADPGVQYDTTINQWHTSPNSGRINASNPCSEYMHVDDSACNLASLNLMKFRRPDGSFDTERFSHAVDIVFLAQEIIVGPSSYPTKEIGENARAFRQLGLGYANLGAFLMANGFAYDSDEGRGAAAAITALMTGRGYLQSAKVAAAIGPYERYAENREAHNNVMRMHRDASYAIPDGACVDKDLLAASRETWNEAVAAGELYGYRNAQATVLAPTGTISFLMDCDTTGIEPDFSLVKYKELVGGGTMVIANRTVPMALRTLGYDEAQVEQIEAHITEHGTIVDAPGLAAGAPAGLRRGGRRARDLARGPHQDDGRGPAVPLGRDLQDGQHAADGDGRGHRRGLRPGVEARRQGAGDLPRRLEDRPGAAHRRAGGQEGRRRGRDRRGDVHGRRGRGARRRGRRGGGVGRAGGRQGARSGPARNKMPRERQSITHKFSLGGHEGYITAGMYEDGTVGEIFLTDIGKEGSTLRGMMNSFATAISIALQYGVPLDTLVRKFAYMRFEPEGITTNPEIPFAKSMPDYIMRWLASRFLDADTQEELGILTPAVRAQEVRRGPRDRRRRRRLAPGQRRRLGRVAAKAAAGSAPGTTHPGPAGRSGADRPGPDLGDDGHPARRPGPPDGPGPRPGLPAVRRHDAAHGLVLHVLELRQQHRLRLSFRFIVRLRRAPCGAPFVVVWSVAAAGSSSRPPGAARASLRSSAPGGRAASRHRTLGRLPWRTPPSLVVPRWGQLPAGAWAICSLGVAIFALGPEDPGPVCRGRWSAGPAQRSLLRLRVHERRGLPCQRGDTSALQASVAMPQRS